MSDLGNKLTFSKNLKYYLERSGKDRKEVCSDLGFKYSTFCEWISAKKYPRIDKIELLANYFKILKSDLIEDKTKKDATGKDLIHLHAFENLTKAEKSLLSNYRQLNPTGQKKVLDFCDDLISTGKYTSIGKEQGYKIVAYGATATEGDNQPPIEEITT